MGQGSTIDGSQLRSLAEKQGVKPGQLVRLEGQDFRLPGTIKDDGLYPSQQLVKVIVSKWHELKEQGYSIERAATEIAGVLDADPQLVQREITIHQRMRGRSLLAQKKRGRAEEILEDPVKTAREDRAEMLVMAQEMRIGLRKDMEKIEALLMSLCNEEDLGAGKAQIVAKNLNDTMKNFTAVFKICVDLSQRNSELVEEKAPPQEPPAPEPSAPRNLMEEINALKAIED